jgi:hypothetical protein
MPPFGLEEGMRPSHRAMAACRDEEGGVLARYHDSRMHVCTVRIREIAQGGELGREAVAIMCWS